MLETGGRVELALRERKAELFEQTLGGRILGMVTGEERFRANGFECEFDDASRGFLG